MATIDVAAMDSAYAEKLRDLLALEGQLQSAALTMSAADGAANYAAFDESELLNRQLQEARVRRENVIWRFSPQAIRFRRRRPQVDDLGGRRT